MNPTDSTHSAKFPSVEKSDSEHSTKATQGELDFSSSSQGVDYQANPKQPKSKMKAMISDRYGPLSGLALREISVPEIGEDEVRIRVKAAGLHVGDCFAVRGSPLVMRVETGWFGPKCGVPGFDVAGVVEHVGKNVTRFKVGDEVFGECSGSCAEYACAKAERIAFKPSNISFEQAAAIPTSALAAFHALRDVAAVQAGQKVLINGASGGVGSFAVQIAKYFGAEVTGVCSTKNVELVRSIGADHVIDYRHEDFCRSETRYDVIFDNVENRRLSDCRRVLAENGTLVLNSGTGAQGLRMMIRLIKPLLLSPLVRQNLRRYLSSPNHNDLMCLKEMVEFGKVSPVVDRIVSLEETASALEYIDKGHARGKVVVRIHG